VTTTDYALHFNVPPGLMPDSQYDGRPAKIQVHRVQPAYARGKCADVPTVAAVLIHGRGNGGRTTFDLRHPSDPAHESALSVQEGLARAGVDTFVPDLLGYGRSTRFGEDEPCNASLPADDKDTLCSSGHPGHDFTHNAAIFPLDQQGSCTGATLAVNPLAGVRCAHTSSVRFGTSDVWARDIRQVVDDAIAKAAPGDGKIMLIGYSFGSTRVGRAIDPERNLDPATGTNPLVAKVSKLIFIAPLFRGAVGMAQPRDEPAGPFANFPLTMSLPPTTLTNPALDAKCPGYTDSTAGADLGAQFLEDDEIGSQWGGMVAGQPTGVVRAPTFSTYGFNEEVAAKLTVPTLVIQGLDDTTLPPPAAGKAGHLHSCALYNALPDAVTNKVLVELDCASHTLVYQGCRADPMPDRCQGHDGVTPYGQAAGEGWQGPHAAVVAAMVEWIRSSTFTVPGRAPATTGKFYVSLSGVTGVQGEDGTPVMCPVPWNL
jgi:pimeloyl-ACP methyl ester carboxylesterase